jgi:hypothetical protein
MGALGGMAFVSVYLTLSIPFFKIETLKFIVRAAAFGRKPHSSIFQFAALCRDAATPSIRR